MKKLECNLDSVEIVKECNAAFNRRQHRAALVATIAGFISGVAFASLVPMFGSVLSGLEWDVLSKILDDSSMSVFSAVLGVALASFVVAFNSYEISLALMDRSCRVRE